MIERNRHSPGEDPSLKPQSHSSGVSVTKDGNYKKVRASYVGIEYNGRPAILVILREKAEREQVLVEASDLDLSLSTEEHKLVRILKVLLEEIVRGE